MTEYEKLKPRLEQYLTACGIKRDGDKWSCPNHDDKNPSATIYDHERLYCPVCELTMDVFDAAGIIKGLTTPKEQFEEVNRIVGTGYTAPATRQTTEKPAAQIVPVSYPDEAKRIFTQDAVERIGEFMLKEKHPDVHLAKAWPCKSVDGKTVYQIDARFEYTNAIGKTDKDVITIYYNGKTLKAKSAPCRLYNLDQLPGAVGILFHEGCKAADAGREVMPEYAHLTWNGGAGKVEKPDLSELSDFTHLPVYLIPDDDPVNKKTGKRPGLSAMLAMRERLRGTGFTARVVTPYPGASEVKKGADIVEWRAVANDEQIREYVIDDKNEFTGTDGEGKEDASTPAHDSPSSPVPSFSHGEPPFRTLGIDDQGMANFINYQSRLLRYGPASLTKNALLTIADLCYWEAEYPQKGGVDWEAATNDVIQLSMETDFSSDLTRGRGAWKERVDGVDRLVYFDGCNLYGGEKTGKYLYVRRPRRDIGLETKETPGDVRREIFDVAARLTWQSKADCLRVMAWSVLSPFCGALPWRPAGLLTGASGSGKSTVVDYMIRPLAMPLFLSGGESTEAGIRQTTGIDARNVVLEESESDSDSKKRNREAALSLMRQSTTDDTPKVAKGSVSGNAQVFNLKNMYLFVGIDPAVGSVADENRIFRAHMVQAGDDPEWKEKRDTLKRLVLNNPENCAGIRAFTWSHLPVILEHVEEIADIIGTVTGRDLRWSTAEAMLMSAYFIVWRDTVPTKEQAEKAVRAFYDEAPPEEKRDQTDELLQDFFDTPVQVSGSRGITMTVGRIASCLLSEQIESESETDYNGMRPLGSEEKDRFRATLGIYGVAVMRGDKYTGERTIGIADNNKEFRRITRAGAGYHHMLKRHPAFIEHKQVRIDGKTRLACVFSPDVVDKAEKPPF
jgi:putative DNA primase/helicase